MEVSRYKKGIAGWVRWTIQHKKVVYLLVAALCVLGIWGVSRINKDEFPTFEIKQGLVVGIYPGASAHQVELELTSPLENSIRKTDHILYTQSYSYADMCYILVTQDVDVPTGELQDNWVKMRNQLNATDLPAGSQLVVRDDFGQMSGLFYALKGEGVQPERLSAFAEMIRRELQKLLAREVTVMVHGVDEYDNALAASQMLFGNSTSEQLRSLDERTFLAVFSGVPTFEVSASELPCNILDFLAVKTGIYPSKGEARKALQQNGFSLNKDKARYQKELSAKRKQVEALKAEMNKMVKKSASKPKTAVDEKLDKEFADNYGKLPWPADGPVVDSFGKHYHPVYKNVELPFNNGMNIALAKDTAIKAVFDGVVANVVVIPGYNQCVLVQHGGYFTFYCKLASVNVKAGEKVKTGQVLGRVDTIAGETQLHFELWEGKTPRNPELWLR